MKRIRAIAAVAVAALAVATSAFAGGSSGLDRPIGEGVVPPEVGSAPRASKIAALSSANLAANELLAGAAKIDIFPRPDATKGESWVRNKAACTPATSGDVQGTSQHVHDFKMTWPENPNCIYMGGFGVGPTQPVVEWDAYDATKPAGHPTGYGLWARTAVFARDGKALVVTILDGEGYFGEYNNMCPPELACGAFDIAQQLGSELGVDPASFVIATTHAHSAMDFIGGWGGVPTWYMRQVAESIRDSVRAAFGVKACPSYGVCVPLQPATIEGGETLARSLNSERRDTYRSAEDPTLNWVRALGRPDGNGNRPTIATVGAFAAHATSFGASATMAHADWPGVFDKRVEERFGGIGLMFEAGLGNMSSRGGALMGKPLADLVPAVGHEDATSIASPVVKVAQEFWNQPVTNGPLGGLGAGGFFDRKFSGPATVEVAKSSKAKPCRSVSAVSVRVAITAAKIGPIVFAAAPGEVFANYTNTIEERSDVTAIAIAQANDAIGYMPQSFESDHSARQGLGFAPDSDAGLDYIEYEDAYSLDACFGDKALETTLARLSAL